LIVLICIAGEADQAERDSRSIFIGNVDFSTSVEEVCAPPLKALRLPRTHTLTHEQIIHAANRLAVCRVQAGVAVCLERGPLRLICAKYALQVQALFADCGEINAITIPVDKFSGRAKGFAYLEFASKVWKAQRGC